MRDFIAFSALVLSISFFGVIMASSSQSAAREQVAQHESCAIEPTPPRLPPLGCKELVATCICEQNGTCRWVFICTPSSR